METKGLKELLQELAKTSCPILVRLSKREGHHFLLDRVIRNAMQKNEEHLVYKILDFSISAKIMQELQLIQNPALLLVEAGEIKAIFSGVISPYQLEAALVDLAINRAC